MPRFGKTGRNDPCWCGSKIKFKRCHLNRGDQSPLPFSAIVAKVRESEELRICLHPDASKNTCGKIISAHTLQRARVLDAIKSENHVLTFFRHDPSQEYPKPQKIGWRKASTFAAFCDQHDDLAFAPLEKAPFSGTKEQLFLIAYRAVCWELYQKIRAISAGPIERDLIDRGKSLSEQQIVQEMLAVQQAGFQKGLADVRAIKAPMDAALRTKDLSALDGYEIIVDGPLAIAATGAITPNSTIGGTKLQTLHLAQRNQWLPFGVDIGERGVSIVFLWLKDDEIPRRYMQELAALTEDALLEFLVQFFFVHCENTYFSTTWWEELPEVDRLFLTRLAKVSNPYYPPPKYELRRRLAPWRLLARKYL